CPACPLRGEAPRSVFAASVESTLGQVMARDEVAQAAGEGILRHAGAGRGSAGDRAPGRALERRRGRRHILEAADAITGRWRVCRGHAALRRLSLADEEKTMTRVSLFNSPLLL